MGLWTSEHAAAAGISISWANTLLTEPEPDPHYADFVQGFTRLSAQQLERFSYGPEDGSAGSGVTFVDGCARPLA